MEIARTSSRWHWLWCIPLCALAGFACSSGGSSNGGAGGTSGGAGTTGVAGTHEGAGSTGTAGAAGTNAAAGTAGTAGCACDPGHGGSGPTGAAGTSGAAGTTGAAGSAKGGSTGTAGGAAGASAKGGATGTAGASAGKGGTTGGAGTTGSAGATGAGGAPADAVPSSGCNKTAVAPQSGKFTIDVSGTTREYVIKIPDGYQSTHPYRLIFALHGRMYDAQSVADGGPPSQDGPWYGVEARAGGSVIFVAGQALSDTSWSNQNGRDVAYFDAMRTKFESELCLDKSREFVMGFSYGAIMTIQMGCMQANIYRAIAPMSGSLNGNSCTGSDPIAYWGSHGRMDPTIDISNGRMVRDTFVKRNHCSSTTTPGTQDGCVNYTGCDPGAPVSWCEFDGVHQPPPFSGKEIWDFFSQF